MKIAIVHDYIKEYGGAERVLETLHEIFPNAPIYTLVYLPSYLGPHEERFKKMNIKTSFLNVIPIRSKLISFIRIIAPFVFKTFDFSDYDVIIVSQTGAYFPNAINKRKAKLITYSHTPPRYLYGYATARNWKKNLIFRILGEIMNHFLRIVDYNSSKNVDYFIANSENVKKRIEKFYRRDATVIYPPLVFKKIEAKKENFYLAGGRLARPKHIDLIVETFATLGLPLKVFGREFAGYEEEIEKLKGQNKNIEFLGEISDEMKYELMAKAKAYVFASEDEDFGIIPVEAQSLGTAVIAYKSGGVLETVKDRKTGIFFDDLTVESLKEKVLEFEKMKLDSEEIKKNVAKFDKRVFITKMKDFVQRSMNA